MYQSVTVLCARLNVLQFRSVAAAVVRNNVLPATPTAQLLEVLTSDHFLSWKLMEQEKTIAGGNGSWLCTVHEVSAAKVSLHFGQMRWMLKKYIIFPMKHKESPFWTLGMLVNFNWIKDVHAKGHPERHLHFRWIHFHFGCVKTNQEVARTGRAYSSFLVQNQEDDIQQVYVPGLPVPSRAPFDTGLFLGHYFKAWLSDYGGKLDPFIQKFMHEVRFWFGCINRCF